MGEPYPYLSGLRYATGREGAQASFSLCLLRGWVSHLVPADGGPSKGMQAVTGAAQVPAGRQPLSGHGATPLGTKGLTLLLDKRGFRVQNTVSIA